MAPDEIVKRLRDIVYDNEFDAEAGFAAADLIEQQAKALEEAEEALEPFASLELWTDTYPDGPLSATSYNRHIPPENVVAARTALATIRAARGEKENG